MDRSAHSDDLSRSKGTPVRSESSRFRPHSEGSAVDGSMRWAHADAHRDRSNLQRNWNAARPLSAHPSYHRDDAAATVAASSATGYPDHSNTLKNYRSHDSDSTYRHAHAHHNYMTDRSKSHSMEPNRIQHSALSHSARYYPHGKGYKLPHGLTVKELKDMTSARLAAEARQKDVQDKVSSARMNHPGPAINPSRSPRPISSSLVLERPLLNEGSSSSHNLISSHVQRYHGISSGAVKHHSSVAFTAPLNCQTLPSEAVPLKAKPELVPSSVEWNHRLNAVRRNHPVQHTISNEYYIPQDLSRAYSYPIPNAHFNQSLSFPRNESTGAFIPLQQNSGEGTTVLRDTLFAPVVTYEDTFFAGSSVASRGSSPTDSKTDDRSSMMTDNGWLDIFGRPSSAATIPTVVPSSESFCPDDDNYTLTFSPEHKFVHRFDDKGILTLSPKIADKEVDGRNQTHSTNAVFRSLHKDPLVGCPVPTFTSFHPLSPLRMGSDVANDSFVKSWTNSYIEDYDDSDPNETDAFPLNRLEHDLNALLTVSHEPPSLEKHDFLVSKIDPEFCSLSQAQSAIGIPSSNDKDPAALVMKSSTAGPRQKVSVKNLNGRKSNDGHRHRTTKKKDHAFNG